MRVGVERERHKDTTDQTPLKTEKRNQGDRSREGGHQRTERERECEREIMRGRAIECEKERKREREV